MQIHTCIAIIYTSRVRFILGPNWWRVPRCAKIIQDKRHAKNVRQLKPAPADGKTSRIPTKSLNQNKEEEETKKIR